MEKQAKRTANCSEKLITEIKEIDKVFYTILLLPFLMHQKVTVFSEPFAPLFVLSFCGPLRLRKIHSSLILATKHRIGAGSTRKPPIIGGPKKRNKDAKLTSFYGGDEGS